jgi:hypothetical protein
MARPSLERIEERVVVAGVVLLLGVAVFDGIFGLPEGWVTAALFVALLLILRLLWPVHEIQSRTTEVKDSIASTLSILQDVRKRVGDPIAVRPYANFEEFYSDAADAISHAEEKLELTYVRRYPPTVLKGETAGAYFDGVLQWVSESPTRQVRRVFCLAENAEDLRVWLDDHVHDTSHLTNYRIRVLDWPLPVDAINFAVIDEAVVFLLIAGEDPEVLRGASIASPTLARHFSEYHRCLWDSARTFTS